MAKRKRAPGGGRKPMGEFRNLESPFSLRMPSHLRKQLDNAKRRSGKSISQEVLERVKSSFRRDPIDPSIRALSYLMACIQQSFYGRPIPLDDTTSRTTGDPHHWRQHPFFYIAFKAAVQTLLEKLEPISETTLPVAADTTAVEVGSALANELWLKLTHSKKYNSILDDVLERLKERDDPASREDLERIEQEYLHFKYGLDQAKDDLQL